MITCGAALACTKVSIALQGLFFYKKNLTNGAKVGIHTLLIAKKRRIF